MSTLHATEMPRAWEDHEGWETYYENLSPAEKRKAAGRHGCFDVKRAIELATHLIQEKMTRIWVPGCGCAVLARLLSLCGLEVHATDVSASAVEFQNSPELKEIAQSYVDQAVAEIPTAQLDTIRTAQGSFLAEVHDFRKPWPENPFHIVINERAFQGFTHEVQKTVARNHFLALRPRGTAVFHFMNVQGIALDEVEAAVNNAGFLLPLFETKRWHRKVLCDTGIPHMFILGQPMIAFSGVYAGNKELRDRDMKILQSFKTEFDARAKQEWENSRARAENPDTRFAQFIYGTG